MEFPYTKFEAKSSIIYRPCLPITFSNAGLKFQVGNALVDTGSDFTILPLEIAHFLKIELDDSKVLIIDGAGGNTFKVMPSRNKVEYVIEAKKGYRSIKWQGTIYFTETEPIILLGHYECLNRFDMTFCGPRKLLQIIPRFEI